MPEPVITKADEERVEAAAAALSEHFDSVRIFVTKHEGGTDRTGAYTRGKGNWYSQFGLIKAWISARDRDEVDAPLDE